MTLLKSGLILEGILTLVDMLDMKLNLIVATEQGVATTRQMLQQPSEEVQVEKVGKKYSAKKYQEMKIKSQSIPRNFSILMQVDKNNGFT